MASTNHNSTTTQLPSYDITSPTFSLNKTTTPPFTIVPPNSAASDIQTITFGVLGLFLTLATIYIGYLQLRRIRQQQPEQRRGEQEDVEMQRGFK
jgi:hypothetical protein